MKKWIIITIIFISVISLLSWFIYWDQTRCYKIKKRCTPVDLSKVEDIEDIDFYRSLNEKCIGKCWTAKIKLEFDKRLCKYKYKQYREHTKDRRYFRPDTYNPCPELYTLKELNEYLY